MITHPCEACPWRLSNRGRRHPDGWYTVKNLRRLWAGLRRGNGMTCHPTDPKNLVTERAQAAGYRPAPEHAKMRECAGALVVLERELHIAQSWGIKKYLRDRRLGMTMGGLVWLAERFMFSATPLVLPLPKVDLNEADIGHPNLAWDGAEAYPQPVDAR